jgi:hypothetical protein
MRKRMGLNQAIFQKAARLTLLSNHAGPHAHRFANHFFADLS